MLAIRTGIHKMLVGITNGVDPDQTASGNIYHKSTLGFRKGGSCKSFGLFTWDLNPCDLILFSKLKKILSGKKYKSRKSLGSAIYQCHQQTQKKTIYLLFAIQNMFQSRAYAMKIRDRNIAFYIIRNPIPMIDFFAEPSY